MSKNKSGKGGKNWKKGKKGDMDETRRELIYKEDGQEYGQVLRMLGDGRCEVYCFDRTTRMCLIRGTMRRRVWINVGDIVLVSLRDFQEGKADIVHKYTPDESRTLKQHGEIPETVGLSATATDLAAAGETGAIAAEDTGFDFEQL